MVCAGSGITDYKGPSWMRRGGDGGGRKRKEQFRLRNRIALPSQVSFLPRLVNNRILVGLKDTDYLLVVFSLEGQPLFPVERRYDAESLKSVVEMGNWFLVYSHSRKRGIGRLVNEFGEEKAEQFDWEQHLRFQVDPEDGGLFTINEDGRVRKFDAGSLWKYSGVLSSRRATPNIFLLGGETLFVQERYRGVDFLCAYHKSGTLTMWERSFGATRLLDAFLGNSFDAANPDYQDKIFLSSECGRVFALDVSSGDTQWETGPLQHAGGKILLQPSAGEPSQGMQTNREGEIFATNPQDGAISALSLYSQKEGEHPFPRRYQGPGGFSRPTALSNTKWMITTCKDGCAYVFKCNIGEGEQVGQIQTNVTWPFAPLDLGNNRFALLTADRQTSEPTHLSIYEFDY